MRHQKIYVKPSMRDEEVNPEAPNFYEVSVTIHRTDRTTGGWLQGETIFYGDFSTLEEAKEFANMSAKIEESKAQCQTNETTTKP